MHEYPITLYIIKIAEKHCKEAGASRVKKIKLVIGDYSGYVSDSVHMYFDLIGEGTMCEGAEIEIENVKPMLRCSQCGELFKKKLLSFECPHCGGEGGPTEIGKEFYVESIEVE